MTELPDTTSPTILLVRLSAIGDVVHGMPVLCALRERWPDARIGWVVEPAGSKVLAGHPALDECLVVPRRYLKSLRAIVDVRRRLRAFSPDIAIDMQGLAKSALTGWLSGASRRIGFSGADGREGSPWLYTDRVVPQATHVIDRNLELLSVLDIASPTVRFDIPVAPDAVTGMEAWRAQNQLEASYAVINPGAGWESKRWSPERYAAVARHLMERHATAVVVVWAGDAEKALAQEIVRGAGEGVHLACPTTLPELVALLRFARICIGSDTGPVHMAAALDVPCVALYGPSSGARNGPYGPDHAVLQKVELAGGSRARRGASMEAMLAISVDDVTAACDRILNERSVVC